MKPAGRRGQQSARAGEGHRTHEAPPAHSEPGMPAEPALWLHDRRDCAANEPEGRLRAENEWVQLKGGTAPE
eukprot:2038630-Prymnesium_polylepis.1